VTGYEPSVGFAAAPDGAHLAYASAGEGFPLVMIPGWLSHVRELWGHPDAAGALDRFTDGHRFVWYDRLGCGLSDTHRTTTSLDDDVDQLVAVLDALELERADVIGYSFGGPTAVGLAVRHPDRVRRLVLYATLASGARLVDEDAMTALIALVRSGWEVASSAIATMVLPEGTGDDIRWLASFQRLASTAENAAEVLEYFRRVDVRDRLGDVGVPTTVISSNEGTVTNMVHARELASGIPGAQLVAVGGKNHDPFIRDEADVVDAILAAIEERPRDARRDRAWQDQPVPQLSRREIDVLLALVEGASNKKIAAQLGVSIATVERHLTHVYRKLDATGRADAAVRGIRLGLVPGTG
jgi:pimeloyl-ACP methyl ester carboxylesterase/DNA-binding CsgD family transcriptional regulator